EPSGARQPKTVPGRRRAAQSAGVRRAQTPFPRRDVGGSERRVSRPQNTPSPRNRVSPVSAFPNGVWERGGTPPRKLVPKFTAFGHEGEPSVHLSKWSRPRRRAEGSRGGRGSHCSEAEETAALN